VAKEEADGGAGELTSSRERGGGGDARLHRNRCSRALAQMPLPPSAPGARPLRRASCWLNLALPRAGPARQDPPSVGSMTCAGLPGELCS
jgi:hypothetical protein